MQRTRCCKTEAVLQPRNMISLVSMMVPPPRWVAEPSSHHVTSCWCGSGVGQVPALALVTGVDSQGVAPASFSFQLLLRRLPCEVEVLALAVAVGAATLVGLSVHRGQVPEPTAVAFVWKEVNATLLFLTAGGLFLCLCLRVVDAQGLSIFSKAGAAFPCHNYSL